MREQNDIKVAWYSKRQVLSSYNQLPGKLLTVNIVATSVSFHEALTLLLMTQSRATNIPLFSIFKTQLAILGSMGLTDIEVTITSLISQYTTFFAFGGSNAISSIDLSSAYNGINNYNVVFVGILIYISNWAGPIWWVSASHLLKPNATKEERLNRITLLTFHITTSLVSVMAACTALRTHLFIWTVFSPKYLYTMAWAMINHIALNIFAVAGLQLLEWK